MNDLDKRTRFIAELCATGGDMARSYFEDPTKLVVDQKGHQDWVSEADRNVELLIREKLAVAFPDDGIIGEEHDPKPGTSGFDWVIDPIDGTTNFVNGIPNWTVVVAGVAKQQTQVGVIHDPMMNETFAGFRGGGAFLNSKPMSVATGKPLASGTIAVGYSNRIEVSDVVPIIENLITQGAMFHRNASGALSLAYVAAGRLLGFIEQHMNAWDCLAGQLLIEEAGGMVEQQDANEMIRNGGRVIAGTQTVFDQLKAIAEKTWN